MEEHPVIILSMVMLLLINPSHAAETRLPITVTIVNLTQMPKDKALKFCDERGMECPNIRYTSAQNYR